MGLVWDPASCSSVAKASPAPWLAPSLPKRPLLLGLPLLSWMDLVWTLPLTFKEKDPLLTKQVSNRASSGVLMSKDAPETSFY